jgi:hypothetical protein
MGFKITMVAIKIATLKVFRGEKKGEVPQIITKFIII